MLFGKTAYSFLQVVLSPTCKTIIQRTRAQRALTYSIPGQNQQTVACKEDDKNQYVTCSNTFRIDLSTPSSLFNNEVYLYDHKKRLNSGNTDSLSHTYCSLDKILMLVFMYP